MEIQGVLFPHFETGTEGILWAVIEDNKTGYAGLHVLEQGDELTIYGDDDDHPIVYAKIDRDLKSGYTEYEQNPGFGQPAALGYWIHWTQKGYAPDDWARLFFHGNTTEDQKSGIKPYRAKLVHKHGN